jgi:diguanylate cyclase (GGDEF)-like protein/PAS domain S-box-containing protein
MAPTRASEGSSPEISSVIHTAHEAFVSMDGGGFITDWNPQAEETFGWSREEALGRVLAETIVPTRFREAHLRGLERFLDTGEGPVLGKRLELAAIHREGYEFPVELTISAVPHGDGHLFHAFLHDISDRKRAERSLAAQHAVTSALAEADSTVEAVPQLLEALGQTLGWELGGWWTPDEEGMLRCRALWRGSGLEAEAFERESREAAFATGVGLPGRVWASGEPAWIEDVMRESSFPRSLTAGEAGLHAAVGLPVLSGAGVHGVVEFFTRERLHREDELLELLETLTKQIGRFFTVLDERAVAMEKLASLALTDELTGLPNRRAWEEGLDRELARARRIGHRLWVAVLDLDHFKAFNDAHGHVEGDGLLRDWADRWRELVRITDLLARYGGEEFALTLAGSPADSALAIVERLRGVAPRGQTCSAGLVCWDGSESPEELVRRADAALYEAKRGGRDRTVIGE